MWVSTMTGMTAAASEFSLAAQESFLVFLNGSMFGELHRRQPFSSGEMSIAVLLLSFSSMTMLVRIDVYFTLV